MTLIASIFPAIRATRVPPIAAVREGATLPPGRFARFRTPVAAVLTVLGFAGLAWGLFGPGLGTTKVLLFMILGTLLVFIGVAMLSTPLIPPARRRSSAGRRRGSAAPPALLARDNARRNPQRTASTAAALMIGLALVTLVATLAAGITQTFRGAVNDLFTGDYAITAQNNFSPIPIAAADAAAKTPGVIVVGNVRSGDALAFGKTFFATAVDPGTKDVLTLDWKEGSQEVLATLGEDGAFVDDGYADDHDLELGSTIDVTFVERQHAHVHDQGDLRSTERRLAVRARHRLDGGLGRREHRAAEHLLVRQHRGRRDRREPGRARRDAGRLPEREGADTRGVHRQPDLGAQLGPQHPLRAARAVGAREPLRDRQHARAQRVREDA